MNPWIFRSQVHAEVCRQDIHRALRRAVDRTVGREWDPAKGRGDIDKMPLAPLLEMRDDCLHAVDSGLNNNVDHGLDIGVLQLHHRLSSFPSSVVDPDINVSKFTYRDVSKV